MAQPTRRHSYRGLGAGTKAIRSSPTKPQENPECAPIKASGIKVKSISHKAESLLEYGGRCEPIIRRRAAGAGGAAATFRDWRLNKHVSVGLLSANGGKRILTDYKGLCGASCK
ncbi:hypothetical protein EVAR_30093_1 [Eumeta japonica]|uniref:Uncharacterized protein n=1 Tax=Eumeta variegata TaxID=151549 RepID=A0A4C1XBM4_EUMVA|nr:hypothetical protein EVAR_30093_1 [Eumeta japonica]